MSAYVEEPLRRVRMSWEEFLELPEWPRNRVRLPDLMMVAARPVDDWVSEPPVLVVEVLSRSTRPEDTIRKSREYAEKGIGQYWVVDPELRALDVWTNVDGDWQLSVRLDDHEPVAGVEVAGVVVPLDLRRILRA